MIDQRMQEAINKQINAEIYSAYLYLSMSAHFQSVNLAGFANWMRVQWQEELAHALKFYDYVNECGGRVVLQPIEAPPSQWDSPLAVFGDVYRHEQKVTGMINKLVDLAVETRDHATTNFLQWFVAEQVEEEASADEVVRKLKLVDADSSALFMIDRELAQRVFVPPAATAEGGAG
ncbi:MAG: ferritin [Dehalococcoidia bacterium]|nr:ferritin [Dehalococcoidia bacterium]